MHQTREGKDDPRAAGHGSEACHGRGPPAQGGAGRPGGDPIDTVRPRAAAGDAICLTAGWPQLCHELRTPLNAILGNTELLLDGSAGPLSGDARACLGDIQTAGLRLMRLVEALLELGRARSRPPVTDAAPVDLIELLRRSHSAASTDAPEIAVDSRSARYVVHGDPGWLKMLADALVELYLDAGAGGAPLQVAADHGGPPQRASLRLWWVDFHPQQLAALPVALIDAILDLHDGGLRLNADGLRLDWPARRVGGASGPMAGPAERREAREC